MTASISVSPFGELRDGSPVDLFELSNADMTVRITNYGGIITSILCPDREGVMEDIVLGFDDIGSYETDSPYFGAIIGRYCNRIAAGVLPIEDEEVLLPVNKGSNHIHGGPRGFDKVVWEASIDEDVAGLNLFHRSVDGDQGYPGNLEVRVSYRLTEANELIAEFDASTDKPTHVNMTQHSYFNLGGVSRRVKDILEHELMIDADAITPVDEALVPTGEFMNVAQTAFDFRTMKPIGRDLDRQDAQLALAGGYDHNFVLNRKEPGDPRPAARVFDPDSGRVMELLTTAPGLQFYSGNFLDGTIEGKRGRVYQQRAGLCLEPQHFPNTPNWPQFPTTLLRPGERYRQTIMYRFLID